MQNTRNRAYIRENGVLDSNDIVPIKEYHVLIRENFDRLGLTEEESKVALEVLADFETTVSRLFSEGGMLNKNGEILLIGAEYQEFLDKNRSSDLIYYLWDRCPVITKMTVKQLETTEKIVKTQLYKPFSVYMIQWNAFMSNTFSQFTNSQHFKPLLVKPEAYKQIELIETPASSTAIFLAFKDIHGVCLTQDEVEGMYFDLSDALSKYLKDLLESQELPPRFMMRQQYINNVILSLTPDYKERYTSRKLQPV